MMRILNQIICLCICFLFALSRTLITDISRDKTEAMTELFALLSLFFLSELLAQSAFLFFSPTLLDIKGTMKPNLLS